MSGDFAIGSDKWPGLSKLVEEMGELGQVAGKLMGTNGAPNHWDGSNLIHRLEEELADVQAACLFFQEVNPKLNQAYIQERVQKKLELFRKWHTAESIVPGVG